MSHKNCIDALLQKVKTSGLCRAFLEVWNCCQAGPELILISNYLVLELLKRKRSTRVHRVAKVSKQFNCVYCILVSKPRALEFNSMTLLCSRFIARGWDVAHSCLLF